MKDLSLQSLPPKWAHFCLHTEKFILNDLGVRLQSRPLIIAYSTGLDSTALLAFAKCIASRHGNSLIAVHLNHNLRPEAEFEAGFAVQTCASLGIKLICGSSDINLYCRRTSQGMEEGARKLRYNFLYGICRKYPQSLLLTAHHLNDLTEDCLMRLIRGSGWPALGGMQAWQQENSLLRPFLLTSKKKLKDFVLAAGLQWQEDSSNKSNKFLRNRIRQNIVPLMEKENPAFLKQVVGLWQQARIDEAYWQKRLQACKLVSVQNELLLPQSKLEQAEQALRLRIYRQALNQLGPGQILSENLFQLDKAWKSSQGGKKIQFPGNKIAVISKKGIVMRRINHA